MKKENVLYIKQDRMELLAEVGLYLLQTNDKLYDKILSLPDDDLIKIKSTTSFAFWRLKRAFKMFLKELRNLFFGK